MSLTRNRANDAAGVTSLPRGVEIGFAIIDKDNVKDPAIARFIDQAPSKQRARRAGRALPRAFASL